MTDTGYQFSMAKNCITKLFLRMLKCQTAVDLYKITRKLLRFLRHRRPRTELSEERVSALLTLTETGKVSIKDLAEIEYVAHSTMSRLVSGLTAGGLAAASAGPRPDRRTNAITLTPKGRRVAQRALRDTTEPLAAAIADLPDRDAAALRRAVKVLDKVVASVSQ